MPIHDQGYRRYGGARNAQGRTWWVIARSGLMERFRERKFIGLMIVALIPFLIRGVQLYLVANFPQFASVIKVTPDPADGPWDLDQWAEEFATLAAQAQDVGARLGIELFSWFGNLVEQMSSCFAVISHSSGCRRSTVVRFIAVALR